MAADTEVRRRADEEQWRQHRLAIIQERFLAGVGKSYRQCSLDNFKVTDSAQRAVVRALKAYQENIRAEVAAGRGIVLYGPTGTGKDHLLIGLGRVAVKHGLSVRWEYGPDLAARCRAAMDSDELRENAIIRSLTGPDVLILSDPIPIRGDLSGYQATTLGRIIHQRDREGRTIWVSMNATSRGDADERLGAPLEDRLENAAIVAECFWTTHRKPQVFIEADRKKGAE